MTNIDRPQVTFYVVHIVRGVNRVWTKPEALTKAAAAAYAESFNKSLWAKTHSEAALVVQQQTSANLPEDV